MFYEDDNIVGSNDFSESVENYFSDLTRNRHKPLTKEEERELIKRSQEGDMKARERILNANLRFVFQIAKKYRGRGADIADLISVGNEGLIESLENFDLNRKVKFISYAVWKIRQNMSQLIKEEQSRCNSEDSMECLMTPQIPFIEDEENCQTHDLEWDIEDSSPSFIKTEEKEQQKAVVVELLSTLDNREKKVIEMFYGINANERNYSLEEISKEMSLSTERVRQLKVKAIKDMRYNAFDLECADYIFNKC